MTAHIHNDEPTLIDALGRLPMVKRVAEEIATCTPPCVFGIHGEWGCGKTSFLHQLQWCLTSQCPQQSKQQQDNAGVGGLHLKDVTTVWFEAWRYQYEQEPIVALLHEIRSQLPLYSKFLTKAGKLADVGIRGALLSVEDLTKRIGFQASKIQQSGEQWEREHLAVALPSHVVREQLNQALSKLIGKPAGESDKRLVVLIDDLDRCEPEQAFRLLEGIKIYLNLESCVFVLGMDERIIERAIRLHAAKGASAELPMEYAREYLDKLCTNIWHFPVIENYKGMLESWLPESGAKTQIVEILTEHRCVAANPRRMKALCNVLGRFLQNRDLTSTTAPREVECLVLMACLYHDHYPIYRMIANDPRFYEKLRRWCTGLEDDHMLLESLQLPNSFETTDKSEREAPGSSQQERIPTFPDPARGNVFRLQSLVEEIGEVEESHIRASLLKVLGVAP